MKFFLIFTHPSGAIYVRNQRGQERWFLRGRYVINKDGSVSPKGLDKRNKNV